MSTRYTRNELDVSGEVDAPADDYWAMLTDWAGTLKWMRVEGRPAPLARVELKAGHELGKFPCTRVVTLDVSALPPNSGFPEAVEETLLHADPVAKYLYYNVEGEGPHGMRNFLSTIAVDDLGDGRSKITCFARFDLPEGVSAEPVTGLLRNVYDAYINDIAAAVAKAAA